MSTKVRLMFSILSRPVPARRVPPPTIPLVRRFHHCQGLIARNALTKPKRPSEKTPLSRCSNQPSTSSAWINSSPANFPPETTVSAIVPTGSSHSPRIGSATKPSRKTVMKRIAKVIKREMSGLRSRWAQDSRSIRYSYLQISHLYPFDGFSFIQSFRHPSCMYFIEPLHKQGLISRSPSSEMYCLFNRRLRIPPNTPISSYVGGTHSRHIRHFRLCFGSPSALVSGRDPRSSPPLPLSGLDDGCRAGSGLAGSWVGPGTLSQFQFEGASIAVGLMGPVQGRS